MLIGTEVGATDLLLGNINMSISFHVKNETHYLSDVHKELFVEIVEKYINVTECKKNDSTTCKQKEKTWISVLVDFKKSLSTCC